ncbi:hypothetical protein RRG08_001466 [Elysia crispata]|uniref:Uncharacterized protein n=1 Tax=Elysia crispata TaxID=231223 RepID=A0AAE0ZQI8_9GAST|nr:hypothetical protein RRG08_001466 [Elysia crispata]
MGKGEGGKGVRSENKGPARAGVTLVSSKVKWTPQKMAATSSEQWVCSGSPWDEAPTSGPRQAETIVDNIKRCFVVEKVYGQCQGVTTNALLGNTFILIVAEFTLLC